MVLVWAILVVCAVLSADSAWGHFRDWRGRRLALKNGRTLTQKFSLYHD
jgi:hypothetical protein